MTRQIVPVLAACLLAVAGAAWAQGHARKVAPQDLGQYWIRTNTHVYAQAPNSGRGLDKIGCAAVTYVIGTDGNTRDVTVAKVVPSTSDFQITASSMIKALHYAPAEGNAHRVPVSTYFIVPFNVPADSPDIMARVLKSCHLPGYGD